MDRTFWRTRQVLPDPNNLPGDAAITHAVRVKTRDAVFPQQAAACSGKTPPGAASRVRDQAITTAMAMACEARKHSNQ